jgi:hypothetical protein
LHGFYYRRVEDKSRGQLFTAPLVLFLSVILTLVLEGDGRLGDNPAHGAPHKSVCIGGGGSYHDAIII